MNILVLEKEARGRAGEFRVASELCCRKMFSALRMERIEESE